MKKNTDACTSIMVGKKASLDGATFIARNEDRVKAITPKRFVVKPAVKGRHETYISPYNKVTVPMPEDGMRYTSTPHLDQSTGPNEEDGINEANVAASFTESVYANDRVLAYDPYVKNGLAEDSLCTLILPFIHSAREGVEYTGKLVAKYGSAEGNGIQFSDEDSIWYMEIVTGHQWVAVRIPDDCYAVTPNQMAIEDIDFNDPDNYMWADGIREFVEKHQLNPDENRWDFRHIFGTKTKKDHHYNTPRTWFAQRYLSPKAAKDQMPEDDEMPFIRKAEFKISFEDIQYILKSHFNETPYDPMSDSPQNKTYRAISLSRTAQSHILQVRNSKKYKSSIHWIELGVPAFNPYVPFFANSNDTDESYREVPKKMDLKSAYWLNQALAEVVESHYDEFMEQDTDYQNELNEWARRKIAEVDEKAEKLDGQELIDYLTEQNHEIASHYNKRTLELFYDLLTQGCELSKMSFKMDPNL
ncbi:C69 family dipeptidase [Lactobacillus sp. PSON]|uniref:C69 family dipeptidase n=1 Tax=Lactobacillus sp. PSON TaxID=3455454 RepID=UPI00404303A0